MRRLILMWVVVLASLALVAQQPPVKSPLLDHVAGKWVLQGTIAKQQTVHDVEAEWVLDHHYLRIHEVDRAKNDKGQPKYEALVYIAWNEQPKQYSCAWLDVYGGFSADSIGVAAPEENRLPFVFKDAKGDVSFTNEFVYSPSSDSWEWHMDNVDKGVATPFGRVKLTRK